LMVGLLMAVVMSGGERAGQVGSPMATTPTGAACLAPPSEATGTEGVSFIVEVNPAEVTAGRLANLTLAGFEGDSTGFVTGLDTAWQCWDGSEWVDIFQLLKGTAGYAPGVAEPGSGIDAIGLILPVEASIRIPDVGPGIYRVFESAAGDDGMRDSWTFVEVVDSDSSPPTTTAGPDATTPPAPESCQAPPLEALGLPPPIFDFFGPGGQLTRGQLAEIFVGPSATHDLVGNPVIWQCWNGSEWINTHAGAMATAEQPGPQPSVYRWESQPRWASIGMPVPDTFRIRVPDLPDGIYRIEVSVRPDSGWAIVVIGDGVIAQPEPIASSRIVTITHLTTRPMPGSEVHLTIAVLDTGEELIFPGRVPAPCVQMEQAGCWGAAGLAEDGVTILAFQLFVIETIEPGVTQRVAYTMAIQIDGTEVIVDSGIRLQLVEGYPLDCHGDASALTRRGSVLGHWVLTLDPDGLVVAIHCLGRL
jgi:hypothetical protein